MFDLSFDGIFEIETFSSFWRTKMEDRIVEINAQIEESRLDQLKTSLNNLGVQFTVQKQLTFEDLGLAEVQTGYFQCLVCSKIIKRKNNAVAHFKKLHTNQVTNKYLI